MSVPPEANPERSAVPPDASRSDEEDFAPVGTMAIMVILAAVILGIWLFLYFGVFVPRGGIS